MKDLTWQTLGKFFFGVFIGWAILTIPAVIFFFILEDEDTELYGAVFNEDTVYFATDEESIVALEKATGKEKWKKELDSGYINGLFINEGVLYFGTDSGQFFALDSQTGNLKWKTQIDSQ